MPKGVKYGGILLKKSRVKYHVETVSELDKKSAAAAAAAAFTKRIKDCGVSK